MLPMRRIIIVDKRTVLCVACVVSVFIVVDINTRSHRGNRNVFFGSQIDITKHNEKPSVFGVFHVFPSNRSLTITKGQGDHLLEAGNFINRYFKLDNCDDTKRFQFYLLRYEDEPALTAKESFENYLNESSKQCQRQVPIAVDDFLIKDPAIDGRFLRDVILDAYLDNVDYYYIISSENITESGQMEVDVSHCRDILLQRSSHGVGVVAAMNPKESASVSRLFFSKVHVEIFGAAFPVRISELESALSYIAELYSSNHLAIDDNGEMLTTDTKTALDVVNKWKKQLTEDTDTLNRLVRILAKQILAKKILAKQNLAKQILAKQILAKQIQAKQILSKQILAKQILAKQILAKQILAK